MLFYLIIRKQFYVMNCLLEITISYADNTLLSWYFQLTKINIKLSKTKTKSKVAQQLKVFIKALHFIQSDAECLYKAATKVVENYALLFYSFHVKNFSYTSMLKRLTFYSVLNIVSERLGKWLKNDSNVLKVWISQPIVNSNYLANNIWQS